MSGFRSFLAIFLVWVAFSSVSHAQLVYSSFGTLQDFSLTDSFYVEGGQEYLARLTDVGTIDSPTFDNFVGLSMVIFDEEKNVIEQPLILTPDAGSGPVSNGFIFIPLADALYSVALAGQSEQLSTYTAIIAKVPIPQPVWLFCTALLGLVSVGHGRKRK